MNEKIERVEVMKDFNQEISRLRNDWRIEDLMIYGRTSEVRSLVCQEAMELTGSLLKKFVKEKGLFLKKEEISEESIYETIFLVYALNIPNNLAFEDIKAVKKLLEKAGMHNLLKSMSENNFCDLTIEQLVGVV